MEVNPVSLKGERHVFEESIDDDADRQNEEIEEYDPQSVSVEEQVDGDNDASQEAVQEINDQEAPEQGEVEEVQEEAQPEAQEELVINKTDVDNENDDNHKNDVAYGEDFEKPDVVVSESDVDPEVPNDEDEEYDPESAFQSDLHTKDGSEQDGADEDDEDDYDPEQGLKESPPPKQETIKPKGPNLPPKPAGLPPKPPVAARSSNDSNTLQLKEAYDAIMQSEIVKDPNFVNLPQSEQIRLIGEQLAIKHVQLPHHDPNVNYDQVYSYNKPFKNLKDPIPLVPINEFCRRPNITVPMSPEEREAYDAFIKTEAHCLGLQSWEGFPDNSRLFVGNLPANTVSKQDLFRIFSQYGEVVQISIKAGYGFIQFRTAEACFASIKGETNVPLHNKIMRLDASKPQKSKKTPTEPAASRGRERSVDDSENKRRKLVPDCNVYITGKTSLFFVRKVKKAFASAEINIVTEDITHQEVSDVISEAAYSGVLGICVVKETKVDVQTFDDTPDGGIKFDEYADVDPDVAADILLKAKQNKYGDDMPAYHPLPSAETAIPSVPTGPLAHFAPAPYPQQNNSNQNLYDGRRNRNNKRENRKGRKQWDQRDPREQFHQQYPQPYGQPPPPQYNPQPYGQAPQPYGQPPQLYQQQLQRQQVHPQPQQQQQYTPTIYDSQPAPNNLLQSLQSLDPASVQSVINILQQQLQPTAFSPPNPQALPYGGYNQPYGSPNNQPPAPYQQQSPPPPPSQNNPPSTQVNALLSQLQLSTSNHQSGQQNGGTQALMETLARLSRK